MSRSIDILKKLDEIDKQREEKESNTYQANSDFDEGEIRFTRCLICEKVTKQRVDERNIHFGIGDRCNPSFHEITTETVIGWWCCECDDEVQIIEYK